MHEHWCSPAALNASAWHAGSRELERRAAEPMTTGRALQAVRAACQRGLPFGRQCLPLELRAIGGTLARLERRRGSHLARGPRSQRSAGRWYYRGGWV